MGKIALCLCFFFAGLALGYKTGKDTVPAQQTRIEIKDIKTKKGGSINLNLETDQKQENKPEKKKRFLGIF
jgi:hypothetical protein